MVRNAPGRNLIQQLKRQRGFAWSKYYKQVEQNHHLQIEVFHLLEIIRHGNNGRDAAGEPVDDGVPTIPLHFTKEVEEMHEKLKKELECPVCLDTIEKGKLKITGCGHKYCETCLKKLDKCAICRRKIKK